MGVLRSGIRPGCVALHDKALLPGSFPFCRAETTVCSPGAAGSVQKGALRVERGVLRARAELEAQAAAPWLLWRAAGGPDLRQGRGGGCREQGLADVAGTGFSCSPFVSLPPWRLAVQLHRLAGAFSAGPLLPTRLEFSSPRFFWLNTFGASGMQ